jgi:membrane associated rhomboid family serine protease
MPLEPFSLKTQPPAVKTLLAVHTAVYLAQWFAWGPVNAALALTPSRVVGSLWLWQPFTYIFLHTIGIFGFFFYLVHMYVLGSLGRDLAYRWGSAGFAFYYMACGLAGAAVAVALGSFAPASMMGSSTVLLGLLVAFATLAPGARIMFYFMPMTARQLVWLVVILEVLLAVARMVSWVEVSSQLAGMATGFWLVRQRIVGRDWSALWRDWRGRKRAEKTQLRIVSIEGEVDRILDKVLKHGADSLTQEERELMQRYSKSNKSKR